MGMTCVVSKMEKSVGNKKTVQSNYKFVVSLYRSAIYKLEENETQTTKKNNEEVDVDDSARMADEAAHTQGKEGTLRECVYVVTIKRLEGDDWKFRSFQKKLLTDGALSFNGLPEWAQKMDQKGVDRVFEKKLVGLVPDENENGDEEVNEVEDEKAQEA